MNKSSSTDTFKFKKVSFSVLTNSIPLTISCGPPILIESGENNGSPTCTYPGAVETSNCDLIGTFLTKY